MPQKLTTTVNKITTIPNSVNAAIIGEFYQYMRSTGASEVWNYVSNNTGRMIYSIYTNK